MATPEMIIDRLNPGKFDASRAARFDLDRAKGSLESALAIERLLNIDDEDRTAEFAFATDQPIEHWFGYLTLDVSKKAVILDRVESGVCPFLVNHDRGQQAGVVIPGSVTLGSVIRGKVKFSRSALGEEIFQDVKDGIRNGTSIGFLVHDLELLNEKEVRSGAIPQYRATRWEMLENSSASIPADIACGAGRSFEREIETDTPQVLDDSPQTREISNTTKERITMTPEEIAAAAKAAEEQRSIELAAARRDEIVAFGAIYPEYGGPEIVRDMLLASEAITLDDVRTKIQAVRKAQPVVTIPVMDPHEQAARENGGVQLARTVHRGHLKSFKGEKAEERGHG
ncbi:MAG: hypothetical protein ABI539_01160, partial [Acidobacteriota bacterium]